ncbi:MAG: peptidoglycan DD-metalloendopeptidase family protein [Rickettsiales bacterium]|nr:peptidoglycan DD-metalloendopeptidase family protein [Rickettsiales bacterium]
MLRVFLLSVLLLATPLFAQAGQTEINQLQEKLITLAKKLRSGEGKLAKLAHKQARLDARITDARTRMDENREEIDTLLKSLIRLSRTPPEAIVAMPGELRHTLQAAQLMTNLTEQLQTKTGQLAHTLKTLKTDELEMAETRVSLQQQQKRLVASQRAMAEKLKIRKTAYRKNNKSFTERVKEASKIKKSSRDLKQLVTKLEKTKRGKKAPAKVSYSKGRAFSKSKGSVRLPVAGRIIKRFGQKEGVDQTSHGYKLASAAGATVISPASGEVMFTGPFLDYGNIVILRYDRGYHLLLAGMDRIDCSVGQKIRKGEPVGRLKGSNNSKADLYMELRKNGKPVDPSPWFG